LSVKFSSGFYLNYFNIPNEDATSFNLLFPIDAPLFNSSKSSHIVSAGYKFALDINNFGFYADLRQNFDTNSITDENPFKGFVFNAGFTTKIKIFKK